MRQYPTTVTIADQGKISARKYQAQSRVSLRLDASDKWTALDPIIQASFTTTRPLPPSLLTAAYISEPPPHIPIVATQQTPIQQQHPFMMNRGHLLILLSAGAA
jgi:hypothetical protein